MLHQKEDSKGISTFELVTLQSIIRLSVNHAPTLQFTID